VTRRFGGPPGRTRTTRRHIPEDGILQFWCVFEKSVQQYLAFKRNKDADMCNKTDLRQTLHTRQHNQMTVERFNQEDRAQLILGTPLKV
jgi:hypothetical protein